MLTINYTGINPAKSLYIFAVQGNSNANLVRFVLTKQQDDIDISTLQPFLKIESLGKDYIDKINLSSNITIVGNVVTIDWYMDSQATANKYLKLQLQFEDYNQNIYWQTAIVKINLIGNINVDSDIVINYPHIIGYLLNAVATIPEISGGVGIVVEGESNQKTIRIDTDVVVTLSYLASALVDYMTLATEQDVSALKRFLVLPKSSVTPSSDTDLSTKKYVDDKDNEIKEVIPNTASAENMLVTYTQLMQALATGEASFKGTYNSIEDLPTTGVDNNDYAWVVSTDASGNTIYNKYIYNQSEAEWLYEWSISNITFSTAQWEAINSGIDAILTTYLDGIKNGTTAAPRAIGDKNGNPIDETYIKKVNGLTPDSDGNVDVHGVISVSPYDSSTGKITITKTNLNLSYDEDTGVLTIS